MSIVMIRMPALRAKTASGNTYIYTSIASGTLPPPIKLGRSSVWLEHEIDAVLLARAAGKSDEEVRELIKQLVGERAKALEAARGQSRGAA